MGAFVFSYLLLEAAKQSYKIIWKKFLSVFKLCKIFWDNAINKIIC